MEYISKEIKKGIKIHYIKTDVFKTDLISVFIAKKLDKKNVTANTLIPAVLTSGSKTMVTQMEINKEMESMYGAEMDCGIEKVGDNQLLKFYIESINNKYVLTNENLIEKVISKLFELVFDPFLENGTFKNEYVEKEKIKIKQLIEGKQDNKDKYVMERIIEEMYKDEPYGLYKYGYVNDLNGITTEGLYKAYIELIEKAKIDIVVSGDFDIPSIEKIITEDSNIRKLKERNPEYIVNNETTEKKEIREENIVEESLNVAQGKLVIGLDVLDNSEEIRYCLGVYNTIFGGSATSKLFQNVREKESLAYAIGSKYIRQKNNILIKAGIEIENYEKALVLIKKELEEMKKGNFTEEDVTQAKKYIIHGVTAITEDQETGVNYYITQEYSGVLVNPEQYIEKINKVTKEDVVNIAQKININTIYLLKN